MSVYVCVCVCVFECVCVCYKKYKPYWICCVEGWTPTSRQIAYLDSASPDVAG